MKLASSARFIINSQLMTTMYHFHTINNGGYNGDSIGEARFHQAKFLNILRSVVPLEWNLSSRVTNISKDLTTPTSAYEIANYLKPWHLYEFTHITNLALWKFIQCPRKQLQFKDYLVESQNVVNSIDFNNNKKEENEMYKLWTRQIKRIKPELFNACKRTLNHGQPFYSSNSKEECIQLNNFIYLLCIKDSYIRNTDEKVLRLTMARLADATISEQEGLKLSKAESIELFDVVKEVNLQHNWKTFARL